MKLELKITKHNWDLNKHNYDKMIEQCISDSFSYAEFEFHKVNWNQLHVFVKEKRSGPWISFGNRGKFISEFEFLWRVLKNDNLIVQFPWKFLVLGVFQDTGWRKTVLNLDIRREDVENMDDENPRKTIEGILQRTMSDYHIDFSDSGGFRMERDKTSKVFKGTPSDLENFLNRLHFSRAYQDESVEFPFSFPFILDVAR